MLIFSVSFQIDQMPEGEEKEKRKLEGEMDELLYSAGLGKHGPKVFDHGCGSMGSHGFVLPELTWTVWWIQSAMWAEAETSYAVPIRCVDLAVALISCSKWPCVLQ